VGGGGGGEVRAANVTLVPDQKIEITVGDCSQGSEGGSLDNNAFDGGDSEFDVAESENFIHSEGGTSGVFHYYLPGTGAGHGGSGGGGNPNSTGPGGNGGEAGSSGTAGNAGEGGAEGTFADLELFRHVAFAVSWPLCLRLSTKFVISYCNE
jgi:hypothetical protein